MTDYRRNFYMIRAVTLIACLVLLCSTVFSVVALSKAYNVEKQIPIQVCSSVKANTKVLKALIDRSVHIGILSDDNAVILMKELKPLLTECD